MDVSAGREVKAALLEGDGRCGYLPDRVDL